VLHKKTIMARGYLSPSIWHDPLITSLTDAQFRAFCWLWSNPGRNVIGLSLLEPKQFEDQARVPVDVCLSLLSPLKGLVVSWRGYKGLEGASNGPELIHMLVVSFIGDVFEGNALKPPSNLYKGICNAVERLPEQPRLIMLQNYPFLAKDLRKPLQAPSRDLSEEAPSRDLEKKKEKEKEKEKESCTLSTDAEVIEWAAAWPGEPASGAPTMDPQWVFDWLARMRSRSGPDSFPVNWKLAIVAAWRSAFRTHGLGGGPVNGRSGAQGWQKNGVKKQPTVWELKTQLEALQDRIAEHPANEQSASFISDQVTTDEEEELGRLQKEMRDLRVQLSEAQTRNQGASNL
jgi:predicted transposase YbfD/YdcC